MNPQQGWLFGHPADRIIKRCNSKKAEEKPIESLSINIELSKLHRL